MCVRTFTGDEAAQTAEYFSLNAPIFGAIDWHSYSQLMLRPWGWTADDSPDEGLQKECGDLFRDEVAKVRGILFIVNSIILRWGGRLKGGYS